MTIRTFKAVLAGSAMLALGLSANAAQAATATANAKAQILKAITVTKSADLDFGTIVSGAAASTVALTTAGALTCGTGLTCAGTAIPAGFAITGTNTQVVNISTTNASLTGPGAAMNAVLSPSVTSLTITGTAATDVFKVAGVLSVGVNQVEGVYSGTFTVTANYQ
ncbi:MAG: hypothetical protein JWO15_2519 [Sphingomonadales bacterium]|nr:hypothetical protein [Sphingomonadales bacterium]